MESLFWNSIHRDERGYVEGYQPGYGRFAISDDRRGRLIVFTPASILEPMTITAKGEWCGDYVARLQRETPE